MNKFKYMVVVAAVLAAGATFARPHGGGGYHRGFGHGPAPVRHHHGGLWGHGGRNFLPGFVGGVVGGVLTRTVVAPAPIVTPAPVVVATPTVVTTPTVVAAPTVVTPVATTQQVWVEGRYVDQVQPNGVVVRTWQPGHYETRTVVVQ